MPELPYDPSSRDSILAYAEKLIGRTLRDVLGEDAADINLSSNKGGIGTALERGYFGYEPNSRSEPDFVEADLELKATPLKVVRKKQLVAKERLALGMIDYMTIVSEEWDCERNSFRKKNSHLLLIFYLHEAAKSPLDFVVKKVRLWDFPPEDLEIIRQDWETIVEKVRRGLAHELSEGDTLYLSACTKSSDSTKRTRQPYSDIPAKPRAYSLKASYMNSIISDAVGWTPVVAAEVASGMDFEDAIAALFKPYIGMTAEKIAGHLGIRTSPRPKSFYALITNRILGLKDKERAAEFEKADIQVKTMRLKPNGTPKEDVSFPAFKYRDLVEQEWESSDLREALSKRFFFVIYQLDRDGVATLVGTRFWTMPVDDIEAHAKRCFERTICLIREDKAQYLPKKSENPAVHVRPHGRNSQDVLPTPAGTLVCKKSFWLNGSYLKDQLGF